MSTIKIYFTHSRTHYDGSDKDGFAEYLKSVNGIKDFIRRKYCGRVEIWENNEDCLSSIVGHCEECTKRIEEADLMVAVVNYMPLEFKSEFDKRFQTGKPFRIFFPWRPASLSERRMIERVTEFMVSHGSISSEIPVPIGFTYYSSIAVDVIAWIKSFEDSMSIPKNGVSIVRT
jgi:hypothetical protein